MLKVKPQIVVFVLLLLEVGPSYGLLIDDFLDFAAYEAQSLDGISRDADFVLDDPTSSAVGGYRDVELGTFSTALITADIDAGFLMNVGTEAGAAVHDLTFIWNGTNSVGLGGVDLTDGGVQNALIINGSADLTGDVVFTITDGLSSLSTVTNSLDGSFTGGQLAFRFTDFIGVDMSDVETIKLEVFTSGAMDLSMQFIASSWVPEPNHGFFLACGLVPVLLLKKRFGDRFAFRKLS